MEERSGVISIDLTKRLALVLAGISVAVPFVTSNQIITGTIVNFLLFVTPKKYVWPVIVFPSLAVMARGIIFGPLTPFVYYFIPFIWMGNWMLAKLASQGHPLQGIFVKVAILYVGANVFVIFKIAPKIFLTSMGIMQLVTAVLGGIIAIIILKKLRHSERSKAQSRNLWDQ